VMYEPILMSKQTFDKLNKQQQDAFIAAGKKAEQFAYEGAKKIDVKLVEVYKNAGVEVVTMTPEQAAKWRAIADQSAYKNFAASVEGGRELLDMALSVQ